jgi:hypothetical protein
MSGGQLWFVKLPNGDVHQVTVDQLDTAFEAGHIDANTLVLAEGSSQWTRLGEAAGLDEEPVRAPAYAPAPVQAYSPTPAPVVRHVSAAPQVSRAPVSYATPAGSIRPVAMDLGSDLDFNDMPFKKRGGKKGWVVAVMSLALVGGGVGVAATHGVGLPGVGGASHSDIAAAAAVPVSIPIAPPAPAPAPEPAVQPPTAPLGGTLPTMDSSGLNPRFTEAQKEKLLHADKVHEDQAKSRQASHFAPHSKYKSSSTFTKGGNKYDPLNSDL